MQASSPNYICLCVPAAGSWKPAKLAVLALGDVLLGVLDCCWRVRGLDNQLNTVACTDNFDSDALMPLR
jgi:hypothetical protein